MEEIYTVIQREIVPGKLISTNPITEIAYVLTQHGKIRVFRDSIFKSKHEARLCMEKAAQ